MIGKILYHNLPFQGIGEYKVVGADGEFIFAKCLVCNNQRNSCIVKLNREEGYKHRWKFVSMAQNCGSDTFEDDDGEHNWEYTWHHQSPFFEEFDQCKRYRGKEIINKYYKEIEQLTKQVQDKEEKVKEIANWMNDTTATNHSTNNE